MSVTLKDIAKLANVSHTTIARALKNSPSVKLETRIRIQELAQQMHYVPNASAKCLVSNRSYIIGLFAPIAIKKLNTSFVYEVLTGVEEIFNTEYSVIIRFVSSSAEMEKDILYRRYDGILFVSFDVSDAKYIFQLMESDTPMVVLNRNMQGWDISSVSSDEDEGINEAINYLISLGHTEIAMINGNNTFLSSDTRFTSYKECMLLNGIRYKDDYVIRSDGNGSDGGYAGMTKLLSLPKPPTAVFVFNDFMSVGVLKACNKHGIDVPREMSLVSFDDDEFSNYLIPALTTIRKPRSEMGRLGAEKLLHIINAKGKSSVPITNSTLHTNMILRETCAPPAK